MNKLFFRIRHFFLALILILQFNCNNNGEKLTAEEAGYIDEVGSIIQSILKVGTIEITNTVIPEGNSVKFVPKARNIYELEPQQNWIATLNSVKSIIPPKGLEDFHQTLIQAVYEQISINESSIETKDAAIKKLSEICPKFKELHLLFFKEIETRQSPQHQSKQLVISYKPPMLPVEVSYSSPKGFELEIVSTLDTPYGSFTGKVQEGRGIKKLIIISNGQKRILKLDRPFKLFIPTDFGVQVSNEGPETMIIEVINKT